MPIKMVCVSVELPKLLQIMPDTIKVSFYAIVGSTVNKD